MKKLVINIVLSFFSIAAFAQVNLVPNPSFELIDTCPYNQGQLRFVLPWFCPNVEPFGQGSDLLSTCYPGIYYIGVPNNAWGYQYPKTDSSMVLMVVFGLSTSTYGAREYISVKLKTKLNTNSKYRISFFCNLANKSRYAVKNLGLYFSQDSIALNTWDVLPYQPQIINDYYLTDTLNWMEVKGNYIANGDEEFINIGNFFDNVQTDFIQVSNSPVQASYYYIDDVSVIEVPPEENGITIPNAFTPNIDSYNDYFKVHGQNIKTIAGKIFNRWGKELFNFSKPEDAWDGKYNGSDVSEGVYFYVIRVEYLDGAIETKTGSIELIR